MSGSGPVLADAAKLESAVAAIFRACGSLAADAAVTAADLVAADLEGVPSHGVMLVPMYVQRLKAGSVSTRSAGELISGEGAVAVLDAHDALGQIVARQAVALAVARAKEFGAGIVAVRNAFHFGTAGRYARLIANRDCIGIVASNTRPLMPAPGGSEPLVGNNPIAIAAPSGGDYFPEVDMALSASAMGKIRLAQAAGRPIPEGWAADANGVATTDPAAAIAGMLLPAAGPKGFGLAFMMDLLCGGLSGGAIGAEVRPLYGDAAVAYRCSQLFMALDVGRFVPVEEFRRRAGSQAARVAHSRKATGVERVFAPGELAHAARTASGGFVKVPQSTLEGLRGAARLAGIEFDQL